MRQIPYYAQETDWTCGPAAMRMVLYSFGIKKSEKELARLMDTTKSKGTKHNAFSQLAELFKLNYIVHRSSTLRDLQEVFRQNYLIILCYFDSTQNVGHYAVVKRVDSKTIFLLDPAYGRDHKYPLRHFKHIWFDTDDKEKGWFIGLKK